MNEFTVEIVTRPVVGDAWAPLRHVTDVVPGTMLLEDAEEPTLILPIEAESLSSAAVFVQGVMSVLDIEIVWGRAYKTEPCDVDGSVHAAPGVVSDFMPSWLEDTAATERAREFA